MGTAPPITLQDPDPIVLVSPAPIRTPPFGRSNGKGHELPEISVVEDSDSCFYLMPNMIGPEDDEYSQDPTWIASQKPMATGRTIVGFTLVGNSKSGGLTSLLLPWTYVHFLGSDGAQQVDHNRNILRPRGAKNITIWNI